MGFRRENESVHGTAPKSQCLSLARKSSWGRIINISTDGASGHGWNASYGASKYAGESYAKAAAAELGPYGITVNVVSPGAVQTGWLTDEAAEAIAKTYPLRRIGTPEDIASAVVFFASRQADWITGQVLNVGGGNRMSLPPQENPGGRSVCEKICRGGRLFHGGRKAGLRHLTLSA